MSKILQTAIEQEKKLEPWKIKHSDILTEKDLQKQCEDYLDILKAQGKVWYFHDNDSRKNIGGLPDLIVWIKQSQYPKHIINIISFELKTPKGGGKLTKGQQKFNQFLAGRYNTHHIINNFESFQYIIDELLS